jgi:hypothetical protein
MIILISGGEQSEDVVFVFQLEDILPIKASSISFCPYLLLHTNLTVTTYLQSLCQSVQFSRIYLSYKLF